MIRPSHVNALFLTLNFRILGYFKQIFGEFECILGKRSNETQVRRVASGALYKHFHYKGFLRTNWEVASEVASN